MAGNPVLRSLAAAIQRDGGDIAIFSRLMEGETVAQVARTYGVDRHTLYAWRNKDEERKKLWAEAIRMSAEVWAEDAGNVLDELVSDDFLTSPKVTLGVARSKYKQWQAGIRDPETYGDKKDQGPIVVNVQHLHLDALRQIGRVQLAPPVAEAEIQEAEIEVVEDEGGDEDVAGAFNQ